MAIDVAMILASQEEHRNALAALAVKRRTLVTNMVAVAKADGSQRPQQDVAALLGITQQAVSKIISGSH